MQQKLVNISRPYRHVHGPLEAYLWSRKELLSTIWLRNVIKVRVIIVTRKLRDHRWNSCRNNNKKIEKLECKPQLH